MKHKIVKYPKSAIRGSQAILAAEDDEEDFFADDEDAGMMFEDEDDTVADTIDDISDTVEDLQDSIDEDMEDDVSIEIDNNIVNHYIAECESCQGVFISAVIESDQDVEKISGTCPICSKETDQYLKWVVKAVADLGDKK